MPELEVPLANQTPQFHGHPSQLTHTLYPKLMVGRSVLTLYFQLVAIQYALGKSWSAVVINPMTGRKTSHCVVLPMWLRLSSKPLLKTGPLPTKLASDEEQRSNS